MTAWYHLLCYDCPALQVEGLCCIISDWVQLSAGARISAIFRRSSVVALRELESIQRMPELRLTIQNLIVRIH